MKNKRIIISSLIYSALCIITVLLAYNGLLGAPVKTVNITYVINMFVMFPFIFFTIKLVRDKDNYGVMGGKEAMRTGLRFVVLSAVVLVIFQLAFFNSGFRDFKVNYLRPLGKEYMEKERTAGKFKGSDSEMNAQIEKNITESVTNGSEITGMLFKTFPYGLFCSFLCAVFLRRGGSPRAN
jgi:hypothetical protein